MNKDLNEFMRENRHAFDTESPSAETWEKVEKSVSARKRAIVIFRRKIYKWSAAAAVLFVGLTAVYFFLLRDKSETQQPMSTSGTAQPTDVPTLAPDYKAEALQVYRAIAHRQAELKAFANDYPGLYKQFSNDLTALDSSYRVLRSKVADTGNSEIILKAMLQNLQLQAELLGKQLMIIQQYSTNKNETNEKNIYRGI